MKEGRSLKEGISLKKEGKEGRLMKEGLTQIDGREKERKEGREGGRREGRMKR